MLDRHNDVMYTYPLERVAAMKIDDIAQASLLYDFYGELLSKRQMEVMELYHEENLSLAEIAAEFDISRQGVHDALKNAEKALTEYEEKLGLVARFQRNSAAAERIVPIIDDTVKLLEPEDDKKAARIAANLKEVKSIIDELED